MTSRSWLWLCLAMCCAMLGCGNPPPLNVQVPDQLILYSIDAGVLGQPPVTKSDEDFYGHPVIGKIEVTDAEDRRALMTAYQQGINEVDPGDISRCFWPRHGIRTVMDGQTTDYVICFECSQSHIYNGDRVKIVAISESPQPVFNQYLTKAGIAIAP